MSMMCKSTSVDFFIIISYFLAGKSSDNAESVLNYIKLYQYLVREPFYMDFIGKRMHTKLGV